MKSSEIVQLSVSDLQERIETAKAEMQRMKINHGVSPLENPTLMRKARRDIARMLTILGQKQNVNS